MSVWAIENDEGMVHRSLRRGFG
eukprot:COSAG05_NODE_12877_length_450_cov_7006.820513_1_plen_22_part_10